MTSGDVAFDFPALLLEIGQFGPLTLVARRLLAVQISARAEFDTGVADLAVD
tara:strand:- start:2391 stop:2546 length:156 start_codon:yes stop_codon:yes gene_type:complete